MTTAQRLRHATYGPTSLVLDPGIAFDEYLEVCAALGAIARGHQWWIGDALVDGEERFGEEFAQGEGELGLEPRTAANYRWVAASVEASRRREDLSWSHHAEVARLAPADQRRMLKWAADTGATVRQLRDAVALEFPDGAGEPLPGLGPEEESDVQRRLEEIERRLEAGDGLDDSWRGDVAYLIGLAKRLTRGRP